MKKDTLQYKGELNCCCFFQSEYFHPICENSLSFYEPGTTKNERQQYLQLRPVPGGTQTYYGR